MDVMTGTPPTSVQARTFCDVCGQPDGAHYMYCVKIKELKNMIDFLEARVSALEKPRGHPVSSSSYSG
jgi:hypothetical protein